MKRAEKSLEGLKCFNEESVVDLSIELKLFFKCFLSKSLRQYLPKNVSSRFDDEYFLSKLRQHILQVIANHDAM